MLHIDETLKRTVLLVVIFLFAGGRVIAEDQDHAFARWGSAGDDQPYVHKISPGHEYVRLPAEAAPSRMRQVHAEFMNSTQVAMYFKNGGDTAILPIGGLEMTGEYGLLGSKRFIHHATAVLLAERWNALVFTPIPFGYAGKVESYAGTVGLTNVQTFTYAREIIHDLLDNGFKRVVLLGDDAMYGEAVNFVRSIHRERGEAVMFCRINLLPNEQEVVDALGFEPADDIRSLAALRILGHGDILLEADIKTSVVDDAVTAQIKAMGIGVAGCYDSPQQRLMVREGLNEEVIFKAIAIMREQAKKYDKVPAAYARYIGQLNKQTATLPNTFENYHATVMASFGDEISPDPTFYEPPAEKDTSDIYLPRNMLVKEATAEFKTSKRALFMTHKLMKQKIKDNAIAILPVGAFEMHGPHGTLGTDTFEAHGNSLIIADRWNAVVLPPIYYTYSGATENYPGTASVPPEAAIAYVKAVIESLLDAGYDRVVLNWVHGPGRGMGSQIVKDLYCENGKVVFFKSFRLLPAEVMNERLGYKSGEDIWQAACLKLLGYPGLFRVDEPRDVGMIKFPFSTVAELSSGKTRGVWFMSTPTQHLAVRACVKSGDEDIAIEIMRETAADFDTMPELMTQYLDKMKQ